MIVSRYLRINRDNSIIKFWKRKGLMKSGTQYIRKYQRYPSLKLYHSGMRGTREKTAKSKERLHYETETGNHRNAEGEHG